MIVHSFAKLNLYLKILSLRKDKYHNISTIFEKISLSDKIIIKKTAGSAIKVICNNPQVPTDKTNLCFRAAKLLQEEGKLKSGIEIRIIKRIPVGAGLGGGSSNASSTLLALNKLWNLKLSKKKLLSLARILGADCAFFISGASFAKGSSRGDIIKPIRFKKPLRLWHVLVVPKRHVSTPKIYREWDRLTPAPIKKTGQNKLVRGLTRPASDVKILTSELSKNGFGDKSNLLFNDLESVTFRLYPQVKRIKERLARFGLKAILMSGSGPAVFAVVSSRKEALSIHRQLRKMDHSWRVFAIRTV